MYVHVITGKVVEPCLGTTEALRSHRFLVFMWSWIYRYVFPHSEHQFSDLQNGSTLSAQIFLEYGDNGSQLLCAFLPGACKKVR